MTRQILAHRTLSLTHFSNRGRLEGSVRAYAGLYKTPVCALFVISFLCLASTAASALRTDRDESEPARGDVWIHFLNGGYARQLNSDVDNGGHFSTNRFSLQGGVTYAPHESRSVSLTLGYGFDRYDFSGDSGFAAPRPWRDIHSIRAGLPLRWGFNDKWGVLAIPVLRIQAEKGADMGDGLSGGGFVGITYRFSERLILGQGVGVLTQIEDDPVYFPVPMILWKAHKRLRLTAGRGLSATQGPGLSLSWSASPRWDLFFGGGYERLRFRLDKGGTAPNGVGEDRSFPVFAGVSFGFVPQVRVSLSAGARLGGELRLEDSQGNRILKQEYDPAGFFGLTVRAER